MNTFIENLNWRYAVKKYDPSRKISAEDLEVLKQAIRFSPSSMGLQPYKVLVITDPALREKLKAAGYNQTQITDASVLFVFANIVNFGNANVDAFVKNISDTRELSIESLKGFGDYMKSAVYAKDED
jgi:nitroreductase